MSMSGNVLGVVGVKISLKNVQEAGRINVVRAAYRKLLQESGEPESEVDLLSALKLQGEDFSSSLGVADTQHHMQPCLIAIQDLMLKIQISSFQVLSMPLGSLAVAMKITQNPIRVVLMGKTNDCLFQLGQDAGRVALFVQLNSSDEANKMLSIISDKSMAESNIPTQIQTNTSKQSNGQTSQVVPSTEEVPEKLDTNIVRRRLSQIESQIPSYVTSPESLSNPGVRPKLPPKPTLKTLQRPHSQIYENVAQLNTVVRGELGMKLKLTGVLLPRLDKEELELRKSDRQGPKIPLRRHSSNPSTGNLPTLPKPPTHGDNVVSSNVGEYDTTNDQIYENDYELTSNLGNADPPVIKNNLENAGYLPDITSAAEYARKLSLSGCSDRESKIIIDLLEEEKQHVSVLQDLQNVFAVSAPGSDFHIVVEKLCKFHGMVFCPTLQNINTDFKRKLAEAFTKNRDSFKIYEELLMIHYRHSGIENTGNYRDKLLVTLSQLQKYKKALSALNDDYQENDMVMQEAKDVIDGTLTRADSYLLLDSISGIPFTPDQCKSLVQKGTMKIKNKSLSRTKDHLVILTETHLIIAEKSSSSQKKNRYSGCIRMDTLNLEEEAETSFIVRGIMHPGSGKMTKFTFTAKSSLASDSWVRSIKKVLEKRKCSTIIFSEYGKPVLV